MVIDKTDDNNPEIKRKDILGVAKKAALFGFPAIKESSESYNG